MAKTFTHASARRAIITLTVITLHRMSITDPFQAHIAKPLWDIISDAVLRRKSEILSQIADMLQDAHRLVMKVTASDDAALDLYTSDVCAPYCQTMITALRKAHQSMETAQAKLDIAQAKHYKAECDEPPGIQQWLRDQLRKEYYKERTDYTKRLRSVKDDLQQATFRIYDKYEIAEL